MKLLNLFKKKKTTKPTYQDRVKRLYMLGCNEDTVRVITAANLSTCGIDCAIIFISTNQSLKNDPDKVNMLINSAYKNALGDKKGNNVQWHALQIVEAFKKM